MVNNFIGPSDHCVYTWRPGWGLAWQANRCCGGDLYTQMYSEDLKPLMWPGLGVPAVYPQENRQKKDDVTDYNVQKVFSNKPALSREVHLQTQQRVERGLLSMAVHVVTSGGVSSLYSGLSASILRQLTYSTARFGVYDSLTHYRRSRVGGEALPFHEKTVIACAGGAVGGIVGCPADLVNVRMQADIRAPPGQRRNYRHAVHGLWQVSRHEGVCSLWNGGSAVIARAIAMTACQVAVYDQIKQVLLQTKFFTDNVTTHFTSSFVAGFVATGVTQPVDVLKTRLMNARAGEYKLPPSPPFLATKTLLHCVYHTATLGPLAFFKGFLPAFIRLGPHTILTFIVLEQLRLLFPPT